MNFKTHKKLEYREKTLIEMLEYKRPNGSYSETNFINRFIKPHTDLTDEYGNCYAFIDGIDNRELPTLLFTAHTDTVHKTSGKQEINIIIGKDNPAVNLWNGVEDNRFAIVNKSECLGADDAVGVFLQLAMIQYFKEYPPQHNIAFAFYKNEENGGVGSAATLETKNKLLITILENIDKVISLDRAGYDDIITTQGARCCSDKFAAQFKDHFSFTPARGSFTDSANFTDEFSNSGFKECTNLSVGYFNQHGKNESVDLTFVIDILLPKLLSFNWGDLKVYREFNEADEFDFYKSSYNFRLDDIDGIDYLTSNESLQKIARTNPDKIIHFMKCYGIFDDFIMEYGADFLDQYGFSATDLNQYNSDS
mgnify:CR=1 FL=1